MAPAAVPNLQDLVADPGQAQHLPPGVARDLYVRLLGLQGALLLRAFADNGYALSGDKLLTLTQAAAKLGIAPRTFYRRKKAYPFVVQDGGRERYSERGIEAWIRKHQAEITP
jgi:predicted DNA-binding transcriptional regulator AlpA